jgi:hypothetical protein
MPFSVLIATILCFIVSTIAAGLLASTVFNGFAPVPRLRVGILVVTKFSYRFFRTFDESHQSCYRLLMATVR